jgi:DNA-binding response OmpR family regulator
MKILIAEDDVALSMFLKKGLEVDGHSVVCVGDGAAALRQVEEETPDLLVLDLGLPRVDGVTVLRALQDAGLAMSVMVLTGRTQMAQKLECLNLGADDYLVKPFSLHELLARCRALGRRRAGAHTGILRHSGLRMDRIGRAVVVDGTTIEFTTKEFALLEYLLLQRGRPVPRKELLENVWHMAADAGTNVVDVYVNYLRRKLGGSSAEHVIETVRGEGYTICLERKPVGSALSLRTMSLSGPIRGIAAVDAA